MPPRPPRLLYLVTEDWYFLSHRKGLAVAAAKAGYDVHVACAPSGREQEIVDAGLTWHRLPFDRGGVNPFKEALFLLRLVALYRRARPDVVHHVAIKPVLYGAWAAWLAGTGAVVSAMTGLGHLFISDTPKARIARRLFRLLAAPSLMRRAVWSIFQNPDDLALFERLGLAHAERSVLIRGSGVDVDDYRPTTVPRADPPKALLVARMLKTKGVEEFYRAARILKERGVAVRFELVGAPDPQNPASLDEATLRRWDTEGIVRWRGPVDDVRPALAEAAMAVLPSYREGLPKALIEAAACGLPMVAFDVPGCREIVRHDRTGLLVPLYDAEALADAIERLAVDPALRSTMGEAARAMAVAEFSQASVTRRTLDLYEKALAERDRS